MQHLPVHPWLVHPRTGEPLQAVGIVGGKVIWPIMGGDGTEDDANDDDQDDDTDNQSDDDGDKADDETDWKAKFEAQQRINRNLERRTRKDAQRIKQLEGTKPGDKGKADDKDGDDQPDLDQIRQQAREEAAREALNGRVEDKIEAKARAFADPEDAVAVLLRSHEHDDFIDDGKIDVDAITDALKELGEKKPHLLAQGGKRFQGDGDGGTRKESPTRPKNLGDAVARHYQK